MFVGSSGRSRSCSPISPKASLPPAPSLSPGAECQATDPWTSCLTQGGLVSGLREERLGEWSVSASVELWWCRSPVLAGAQRRGLGRERSKRLRRLLCALGRGPVGYGSRCGGKPPPGACSQPTGKRDLVREGRAETGNTLFCASMVIISSVQCQELR